MNYLSTFLLATISLHIGLNILDDDIRLYKNRILFFYYFWGGSILISYTLQYYLSFQYLIEFTSFIFLSTFRNISTNEKTLHQSTLKSFYYFNISIVLLISLLYETLITNNYFITISWIATAILLSNIGIWLINRFINAKEIIVIFLTFLFGFLLFITGIFTIGNGVFSLLIFSYLLRNNRFGFPYKKRIVNLSNYLSPYINVLIVLVIGDYCISNYSSDLFLIGSIILIYSFFMFLITKPILQKPGYSPDSIYGNSSHLMFLIVVLFEKYNDASHNILSLILIDFLIKIIGFFINKHYSENVTYKKLFAFFNLERSDDSSYKIHPKQSALFEEYIANTSKSIIQDFSYAGYKYSEKTPEYSTKKVFNVTEFGILPDTGLDILSILQELVDKIGTNGGGILYFPRGKYVFNGKKGLSINHSNVFLLGDGTDENGTIFHQKTHTLMGEKNPWLSPFLVNYSTDIQEHNVFWGMQFKNRAFTRNQSGSITDPGTDGELLEPEIVTEIIENSYKGSKIIKVKSIGNLKKGDFILIVLYNTSEDGNLLKKLLHRESFQTEWNSAQRAGIEMAPSFQWLVEIENIRNNEIELKQPLRCDILLLFKPIIAYAQMITEVGIEGIIFDSAWNGLFRHHGAPIYYTKEQSQIMDYGWNALKLSRVAHGYFNNIKIRNFTNPLYLLDSRNITVKQLIIEGHDGHQGIKLYSHACDNLIEEVTFKNHFADMMGGEGNAYGNVFRNVSYENVENKHVDFDFHGFSEAPFSPPSWNLFENIQNFRGIKGAGSYFHQPAIGIENVWWNIKSSSIKGACGIFYHGQYQKYGCFRRIFGAFYKLLAVIVQNKNFEPLKLVKIFKQKLIEIDDVGIEKIEHYKMFKHSILVGYISNKRVDTTNNLFNFNKEIIHEHLDESWVTPNSLYREQLKIRLKK